MADPTWLTKVLRAAGLTVRELPGAYQRGHGDFGEITHVIAHHTGSNGATAESIAHHPDLGLCSQLYLGRDGVWTLCGVGIAYHAGIGSWRGIPTNNANQQTIGIEAASDGGGTPGKPHHVGFPDVQYRSYVRGVAAILNHLGKTSANAIGHKEWAAIQGKWDPGSVNMDWFRRDIAADQAFLKHGIIDGKVVEVRNEIDYYASQTSWLGKRLTVGEIVVGKTGQSRAAEFENAIVYWGPTAGAHAVPRADANLGPAKSGLLEEYQRRGGTGGALGLPIREFKMLEAKATRPRGAVQAFEGGVLYRRDGDAQGYVVHGVIGARWGDEGYETGPLGYPISDEQPTGDGGRVQYFENGSMTWHPKGAVREINADMADVKVVTA
ncbi:N-acetylmuramoyl-L-alanine amidase [Gordonia malaquae]|uniref:N-acetylmuramoyl-L-alanine amidase n=1 Tax=Gordonia TaxID=2053 RepID=UPI0030C78C32